VLTVERMEGLRIDRVGLRLLDGSDDSDDSHGGPS
jgi:hypothetical protein